MDIVIVDCRADNETVYNLEKAGMQIIPTVKINGLYDAVATHADMQIQYIGNNIFVCAPEVYHHYIKLLPKNIRLIKGSKSIGHEYPYDIAYNAAFLKDFIICNSRYTAPEILSEYASSAKKILNVKQGYSKCNICIVNGNAVITSDRGIKNRMYNISNAGVLLIEQGFINLRGMPYGFIGGATGLIKTNLLAVNGDINTHPDSKRIKSFCKMYSVELLQLKSGMLSDIGSIITKTDI